MIVSQQAGGPNLLIFVVVFFVIVWLIAMISQLLVFRPWLRAQLSGTPIPLVRILAMKFRRTDVNQVVSQGIAASQAGFPIGWAELERAFLMGADLEKVVLAYITAQRRELGLTFDEILDADREARLGELLK